MDKSDLPATNGVYIELFHGRRKVNQNMYEWGSRGPVLGPLRYFHTTYGSNWKTKRNNDLDSDGMSWLVEDMIYYDGVYYGDWSIIAADMVKNSKLLMKRVKKFNWKKTIAPESKIRHEYQLIILVWKAYPDPLKRKKQIEKYIGLGASTVKPIGDDILNLMFRIPPDGHLSIRKLLTRKSAPNTIISWEINKYPIK